MTPVPGPDSEAYELLEQLLQALDDTAATAVTVHVIEPSDNRQRQRQAKLDRREEHRTAARIAQLEADCDELRSKLRAEQRLRQRESARHVTATTDPAPAPAQPDETARLAADLAAAYAERDLYAELLDEAEDERNTAITARQRLAARLLQLDPDADATPADTAVPDSFAALLASAADMYPHLTFTCSPEPATALDDHPHAAAWRRRTLEALSTLNHYAADKTTARTASNTTPPALADVLAYVRSGGPGVSISATAVALAESNQVRNEPRYRELRLFPAPDHAFPDGKALMTAHLRIGGVRPPAPRLHFADDLHHSGLLVIGYLGPHLFSPRTN